VSVAERPSWWVAWLVIQRSRRDIASRRELVDQLPFRCGLRRLVRALRFLVEALQRLPSLMRVLTRGRRRRGAFGPRIQDQSVRVSFVDQSINPRPIPLELVRGDAGRLRVACGALRLDHGFGRTMQPALGDAAISFCVSELPLRVLVLAAAQIARGLSAKAKRGHVRRSPPARSRAPRDRPERRRSRTSCRPPGKGSARSPPCARAPHRLARCCQTHTHPHSPDPRCP